MNKHLFLTGFMGVGKTTVGQALAAQLHVSFVDLDHLIAETAGKSIPEIFADEGESEFRALETACLYTMTELKPAVVSTGGGIVGRDDNRVFMQKNGRVVFLSAEWETVKQRIGDTTGRPLADSDQDWQATRDLFDQRQPLYVQADLVIQTDHRTIQDIVHEIMPYAEN